MQERSIAFATLVTMHVILVLASLFDFTPLQFEALNPALTFSVYGPLFPIEKLELPVYTQSAQGWTPSLLGWLILVFIWGFVWLGIAILFARMVAWMRKKKWLS